MRAILQQKFSFTQNSTKLDNRKCYPELQKEVLLMRRIFMGTARCLDQPIRYYLLAEAGEDGTETYGIGVEYAGETAEIPNITPFQHRIQKLAEALMQGCVTPTTLRDVAEDWLLA